MDNIERGASIRSESENYTLRVGLVTKKYSSGLFSNDRRVDVRIRFDNGQMSIIPYIPYTCWSRFSFFEEEPEEGDTVVVACFGKPNSASSMVVVSRFDANFTWNKTEKTGQSDTLARQKALSGK